MQVVSKNTTEFWDNVWKNSGARAPDPCCKRALEFFGDVSGESILEVGCGLGNNTLFWAQAGADVTAIDISEQAVKRLSEVTKENSLTNVNVLAHDARRISELGKFNYIFGAMILHHIEPFYQFADALSACLKDHGKAFFYENNAMSKFLVWCREHLVGKLWIPKYGDPDEFPLTPQEITMLRRHFKVTIEYPELMFFRLGSTYLLKNRLSGVAKWMDEVAYNIRSFRRFSYRQYVMMEK